MASGGWRWLRGLWAAGQPLFQGRALLVTNTLGCGTLMAAGDGARQSWELRARPGQKYDPWRSGELWGPSGHPRGTWARPIAGSDSPGPDPRVVTRHRDHPPFCLLLHRPLPRPCFSAPFPPLQCQDRASLACTLIPAPLLLPLPWEAGSWHALQGARVLQGNSQIAKAAGKHGLGVRLGEGSPP